MPEKPSTLKPGYTLRLGTDTPRFVVIATRYGYPKDHTVTINGAEQLWISAKDHQDFHGDPNIILLEFGEDGLELFVWADNGQEEYTHRISLEGAKADVQD